MGASMHLRSLACPNCDSACWSVSGWPLYIRAVQPRGGCQVSEV